MSSGRLDDADFVDSDDIACQFQSRLEFNDRSNELSFENPALDASDDPTPSQGQGVNTSQHLKHLHGNEGSVHIDFVNTGNKNPTASFPVQFTNDTPTSSTTTSFPVQFTSEQSSNNNTLSQTPTSSGAAAAAVATTTTTPSSTAGAGSLDTSNGINQNGTHSVKPKIRTSTVHGEPLHWREVHNQRPLRQRHMLLLKIFGIIAAILFFPTGIPAALYAFRTETEFEEGIMRGNIDKAQKFARRAEHLIIFSGLLALLTAVIIFGIVERSIIEHDKYWESSRNRIMPN